MSGKTPPFIDEEAERVIRQTRQSMSSTIVMAFGWMLLTVALIGGAYLAYRFLTDTENNRLVIEAPLLILGFTYLAGWVVSLFSIRALYNLVMPTVVKVYTFGVLGGVLLVYFRAIYKIFIFPENGEESMLPRNTNFLVLLAGFLLLVTLSLLVEQFSLRPHAIILLIAVGAHLMIAVYHYVFIGINRPGLESYDVYYLLVILMMALFLTRRYRVLRQLIRQVFRSKPKHHLTA